MISRVTGTTSRTVVTLSRNAEVVAVTSEIITRMPQGLALTFLVDQIARYWKMPDWRVMATINIMPISRPMVLKSMPRMAASWLRMPSTIISPAASSETMARLIFSVITTT